jgi:hypothetical protein
MTERNTAFFINGGAGRVICSIPALEKYHQENPDDNFIIVCEGGSDFYKGHPVLHAKAYDVFHKNLFQDKLINMTLKSPEPYRTWEYYNQKASIAQAYDIEINNKGIRDLQKPTIRYSKEEIVAAQQLLKEIKEKTKKDKIVVFQPFGRGLHNHEGMLVDPSGRSFESTDTVSIVKSLSKKYAVIFMSEIGIEFQKHGVTEPIAIPQGLNLRQWGAVITFADYFLGCDSVGQHLAYASETSSTVVMGSTFKENVSYPNCKYFDVLDMGEGARVYSPIRVTVDEWADRTNEGVMDMNDKIIEVIIKSIEKNIGKGSKK